MEGAPLREPPSSQMSSFGGEWGSTPSSEPEDNLPGPASYYFPQRTPHTPSPTHSSFGSHSFLPPSKLDSPKPLPSFQPNYGSSHRVQVHSRHSSHGPTPDSVQVHTRLREMQKALSQKDLQYKELLASFNTLTDRVGAAINALQSHGQMGFIGNLPTYDREEYPDVQFWTSTSYSIEVKVMAQAKKQKSGVTGVGDRKQQQQRKKRAPKSNDDPAADMWFFLQLADGQVVTEGVMEQIRKLVRALFFDIKFRGLAAESWERVGFTAKSYVYFHLIRAFPFVALCDFNYKAETICHELYPSWKRHSEKAETTISVKEDTIMLSPEESKPSESTLSGLSAKPLKRPGTPTSTNPEPSKRVKLLSTTSESPSESINLVSPPRSPQASRLPIDAAPADAHAEKFSGITFSNPLLNMFNSVQTAPAVNSLSTTTISTITATATVSADKQTTPTVTVDVQALATSVDAPAPIASNIIVAPVTSDAVPSLAASGTIPAPDSISAPSMSEPATSAASNGIPTPAMTHNITTPSDSTASDISTPSADDNLPAPSMCDAIPPSATNIDVLVPLANVDSPSVTSDVPAATAMTINVLEPATNTTSHPDTPSSQSNRDIYPSIPKIGLTAPVAGTGAAFPPTAPLSTVSTAQSTSNAIAPTTQATTNGRPSRKAALVKNPKTERSWKKNYFVAAFGGSEDDFKTWLDKPPSESEEEAYRTWRHAQPGSGAL